MQAALTQDVIEQRLSRGRLANISLGLLGVQIVWGLQNVNTTRIFQRLGADIADLPMLWIAAPITGLLVQPVVGYLSDRTCSRFGRRRPYMVVGAVLSAASLFVMASATSLATAIFALWVLTASVNVAMQPLRSLMADLLPGSQRDSGFAVQVIFIGTGAVLASAMPWVLTNWLGVQDCGPGVSSVVQLAFQLGAVGLLLTVGWTVFTVQEPAAAPAAVLPRAMAGADGASVALRRGPGVAWTIAGIAIAALAAGQGLRREIYLLAAIATTFGVFWLSVVAVRRAGRRPSGLLEIVEDIMRMPRILGRLAVVQFFTWFALFAMWVYAVPAVAGHFYHTRDSGSQAYETGANWVGLLFAAYDGIAVLAAFALPVVMRRAGSRSSHAACLTLGAAGLAGMALLDDATLLWLPAIGIGCAWASILSTPYAVVTEAAPAGKVGVYMGIHNIFLVLPQLVAASSLGILMDRVFHNDANAMLLLAAASMLIAAMSALTLRR